MSDASKIRERVSRAYARAVTRGEGCCSSTCSGSGSGTGTGTRTGKGTGTGTGTDPLPVYYGPAELAGLPPDVAATSFGCGNPFAFSEVREGDTVLDLGSGAGLDLLVAARKVGPRGRVIGVDMTDAMIERARRNIAAAGLTGNVEVRKGLIEDLPVESGSVDWVISNCVINLSPEKARVFAEIARVLRPGGRMLVSDIVVDDLPGWVRRSGALYSACVAGAISQADYLAGLRAAGLAEVAVRERSEYDADELAAIARSELLGPLARSALVTKLIRRLARPLAGKIASVKFFAVKRG